MRNFLKKKWLNGEFTIGHFFGLWIIVIALSTLFLSIAPIKILGSYQENSVSHHSQTAVDLVAAESAHQLENLAAKMMKEKARDVAKQAAILIRGRPVVQLLHDENFRSKVVQKFLNSGYTAVFECGTMITIAHPQRALEGIPAFNYAEQYPSWWNIFKNGIDCKEFQGRYQWDKTDGQSRDKYMVITPIPGSRLMVAATIYLEEFDSALSTVRFVAEKESNKIKETINKDVQDVIKRTTGIVIIFVLLFISSGLWMSDTIITYFKNLQAFAKALASRNYVFPLEKTPQIYEFLTLKNDLLKMRDLLLTFSEDANKQASQLAHFKLARQVAHDIRPPIAVIDSSVNELEKRRSISEIEVKNQLTLIKMACRNISEMTNSILSPKANYLTDVQKFNLGVLLTECITDIIAKIKFSDKKIVVDTNIEMDLCFVGSRQNFKRVFTNLLNNSIEAIKDCGKINVNALVLEDKITIRIIDDGIGIPNGKEEDIFIEGVSLKKRNGNGLGLSFCRMVISLHGGDIVARKNTAAGSTFELTLPTPLQSRANTNFSDKRITLKVPQGKKILVIDDNIHMLSQFFASASTYGIEGGYYSSLEEAEQYISIDELKKNCGLIILDHLIPESKYDAIEMCKFFRNALGKDQAIYVCTSDHKDQRLNELSKDLNFTVYPKEYFNEFGFNFIKEVTSA